MLLTANSSSCLIQKMNQQIKRKKRNLIVIASVTLIIAIIAIIIPFLLKKPEQVKKREKIRFIRLVGVAMEPTIESGKMIRMTDDISDIECGDIIVYNNDKAYLLNDESEQVSVNPEGAYANETLVHRVIAKGGDSVDIHDGKVWVDGKSIDEPYITDETSVLDDDAFAGQYPIEIPEGFYFVLGDNRNHSLDSRSTEVGLVKKEQIIGRVK